MDYVKLLSSVPSLCSAIAPALLYLCSSLSSYLLLPWSRALISGEQALYLKRLNLTAAPASPGNQQSTTKNPLRALRVLGNCVLRCPTYGHPCPNSWLKSLTLIDRNILPIFWPIVMRRGSNNLAIFALLDHMRTPASDA